jgi:hypothetical protein
MNPTQVENLEKLRPAPEERPSYRSTLKIELRHELEKHTITALDRYIQHTGAKPLFIGKRHLAAVHGCEARHLAEEDQKFEWSVPLARGSVTHKAIELSVNLKGTRDPAELVDEAVARIIERENSLGDFLRTRDESSIAELRSECAGLTAGFLDTFPPLRKGWRPGTEVSKRVELCNNLLTLAGKFDLTLGMPFDTTAGRVIIDIKTGGASSEHRNDLRFYALLETLVTGVPPLAVGTHYVESGRLAIEPVDEPMLEAALHRTADGVVRLAELHAQTAEPVVRAGPGCRWCPLNQTCSTGIAWISDADGW